MSLSQRRARRVARLRSRKTREREGLVLVEGVRAATEALDARAEVSFVVTSPRLATTAAGRALADRLAPLDPDEVDDPELADLADTQSPQGVLLVCAEPAPTLGLGRGRYLVLDGVQDPGNAGALIRGAVALGLDGVVCLDGTADPWGAKAVRASAGLVFRCPLWVGDADALLRALASCDVPLLVADAAGEDVAGHASLPSYALVVGNEGAGVRAALRDAARGAVAVPMAGAAESLNVAVAGSILMYALSRRDARG